MKKKHEALRNHGLGLDLRINSYGYGSIPIHTIFRGMNIHLPAILMFTRGTRFWHTAIYFCSPLVDLFPTRQLLHGKSHQIRHEKNHNYLQADGHGDVPSRYIGEVDIKGLCLLVDGAITILKNMSSSMGRMTSHVLWKIKCSKPPTSLSNWWLTYPPWKIWKSDWIIIPTIGEVIKAMFQSPPTSYPSLWGNPNNQWVPMKMDVSE